MTKILSSIWIFFLCISSSFAESLPAFPMTIYGTLQVGTVSLWAGAKLSFYDASSALIGTYTTTREGWYGYDSTIAGTSPIFSGFTGALRMTVEYQSRIYTISSITSSTSGCPVSSAITFISSVCRYDITTTAPVVAPSSSSNSVGGWSSSYSVPIVATTPTATSNTWTTQSGTISTPTKDNTSRTVNETTSKDPIIITPQEFKKTKTIILVTVFKKGTKLAIYRVLPNGRKIQTWNTRVLPNGKIRFTMKTSWKYIFIQK